MLQEDVTGIWCQSAKLNEGNAGVIYFKFLAEENEEVIPTTSKL
jgi:hypothetical protein